MALFERDLITFDFEGSAIRFLLVRGGRVVRWEALSVPPEQMSQGVVHEPAAVGGALRELLDRNDVRKGRVVTSVTGLRAISRLLTLPPIKERLLEDALRHKIRQDTSLPLDDMDLSWHVVQRSSDSLEVYVLAVPREAIDRQVETLAVAGLRPNAMDVKPLALARVVEAPSAIVLNVEDHSLSVLILRQWMPVVVRTVPFGVGRAAPEARLDLLLQELARTTKFYSEGHRDDAIDSRAPLLATGELFEQKDFLEALANRHGGPVQVPIPALPHPDDLPAAMYSVNLGLAAKKV
jgi:Tfp pilus assembly PilM family ATPase